MCNFCGEQSCSGQCWNSRWPFNRPFYNPPYTTPFNRQCPTAVPYPCPTCNSCTVLGCVNPVTTDCVTSVLTYSCIGTTVGASLTTILSKIDSLICSIPTPVCPVWNTITPTNATSSNTVQILFDSCGNVSFRGIICQTITLTTPSHSFSTVGDSNVATGSGPFYTLSIGQLPPQGVTLPTVTFIADPGSVLDAIGNIVVLPNGQMYITVNSAGSTFGSEGSVQVCISLDSIKFSVSPF